MSPSPSASAGESAGLPPRSVPMLCQGGLVLRTVLFVHGVLVLGLGLRGGDLTGLLGELSVLVVAVLPATLVWLLAGCALRPRLARLAPMPAAALMGLIGLLCALGAWAELRWLEQVEPGALTALSAASSGAALVVAVWQVLCLRERLNLPAGTQARLAELQSRIRPHFLFNALNSAITLVQIDPVRAEAVLEDLSELFRAALASADAPVTLGQEIELAQRYLAIEQVRFGARLRVRWQLDAQAAAARVPALMLQPLVENAVKHGIEPSTEGGEIVIRTGVRHGMALLTVTNPLGEGRPRRGHGMALRNVRERLMLLHDLGVRFEAGAIDGGRFRVRIAIALPD